MKRRSLLIGVASALAAPAIVRAESLMRIAKLREDVAGDANGVYIAPRDPVGAFGSWVGPDEGTYWMTARGFFMIRAGQAVAI